MALYKLGSMTNRARTPTSRLSLEEYENSANDDAYRDELVRGPDVAFISRDRIPAELPIGWWPFAPDLVVEVLSRSNRVSAMNEKALNYLEAGTRLVWVIDPRTRIVTVHRSLREVVILRADDRLNGAPVIPELDIAVGELFE